MIRTLSHVVLDQQVVGLGFTNGQILEIAEPLQEPLVVPPVNLAELPFPAVIKAAETEPQPLVRRRRARDNRLRRVRPYRLLGNALLRGQSRLS